MGNLKRRLENLEGGGKKGGFPLIIVNPGESTEEAFKKHLVQHPEAEKAAVQIFINLSDPGLASSPAPQASSARKPQGPKTGSPPHN